MPGEGVTLAVAWSFAKVATLRPPDLRLVDLQSCHRWPFC